MIIVAGHLRVAPAQRERYLRSCREVVTQARATPDCLDFAIGADLAEPDRINILERWASREALDAFRGAGPPDDLGEQILDARVGEFECDGEVGR